jgi:hypothetical protein
LTLDVQQEGLSLQSETVVSVLVVESTGPTLGLQHAFDPHGSGAEGVGIRSLLSGLKIVSLATMGDVSGAALVLQHPLLHSDLEEAGEARTGVIEDAFD